MIYCFHMAMIVWHDIDELEEITTREKQRPDLMAMKVAEGCVVHGVDHKKAAPGTFRDSLRCCITPLHSFDWSYCLSLFKRLLFIRSNP